MLRDERASLVERQQAAEILGWYGGASAASALRELVGRPELPLPLPLRWTAALAFTRVAGADGLAALGGWLAVEQDPPTRRALTVARARLKLLADCGSDPSCYLGELRRGIGEPDAVTNSRPASQPHPESVAEPGRYRVLERAVLEIGRVLEGNGAAELAEPLARLFAAAHPQVKQALLVSLERLVLDAEQSQRVARILDQALQSPKRQRASESIETRALCLVQRLAHAGATNETR